MMLNKITEQWTDAYIANPSVTVLIDTSNDLKWGIELAEYIFGKIIDGKHPMEVVSPDAQNTTGIELVRNLQVSLAQSANRSDGISRAACVEAAHTLTVEAQNALLKLLEELPKRTVIFLIGDSSKLLPTILSRCAVIRLLPVEEDRALSFAHSRGIDEQEAAQAYIIADGSWTTFVGLLENSEENETRQSIASAKEYLASSVYDRQLIAKNLQKNSTPLPLFVKALSLLCKAAMRNAKTTTQKNAWKQKLVLTLQAQTYLSQNVSPRLVLLDLSIKL